MSAHAAASGLRITALVQLARAFVRLGGSRAQWPCTLLEVRYSWKKSDLLKWK